MLFTKKINRLFFGLILVVSLVFFAGCTANVELSQKKDGSLDVNFLGSAGQAFCKMIQAATGNDSVIFENDEIAFSLGKTGFTNVRVTSGKTDLGVSMKDENQILPLELNPQNLYDFYASADEQIVMILDLLLAPVFNKEQMSEAEYLELLASFYGQDIADELYQSIVNITFVGSDGKKSKKSIPMAKILTLSETISLHSSNY